MAEEVAQEAFLIAAQKLDQVEQGRERAFLFGVALRLTANLRRSSAFRREVSDVDACAVATSSDQFDVDELVVQKQQREALDSILDEMPSTFREVLVLHAIEECSLQEIAETLGIPAGTAASRVRRAREDFARRVQRFRARLTHGKEDT